MKVIDLLNKIANGEEVPNKIRIRGVYYPDFDENDKPIDVEDMTIWELDDGYFDYDYYSEGRIGERKNMFQTYLINRILNDEVEIIEEDKKISKDIKWYLIEEQEKEKTKIKNRIKEMI